jgi:hypothetical protein
VSPELLQSGVATVGTRAKITEEQIF